jgi:hypothetical protein
MINNDRILASIGTATLMSAVCPCAIDFVLEGMGLDMNMAVFAAAPVETADPLGQLHPLDTPDIALQAVSSTARREHFRNVHGYGLVQSRFCGPCPRIRRAGLYDHERSAGDRGRRGSNVGERPRCDRSSM